MHFRNLNPCFIVPMNTTRPVFSLHNRTAQAVALACLGTFAFSSIRAATITWGGTDGEYKTGANWVGGSVPNTGGGDTAIINGGAVTYTPGGDLTINNGGSLQINGGSWTQVVGPAWFQLQNGTLRVNGGTFNIGTAGQINMATGATVQVAAGSLNYGTNKNIAFSAGRTLSITGGSFTLGGTGELSNSGGTTTMSGGALNAALMKFSGAASTNFDFSNGTITLTDSRLPYIVFHENSAASFLNFTTGSTGVLNLTSISAANALAVINRGDIRVNGVSDSSKFTILTHGAGSQIYLTAAAVPEPSAYAVLAGSLILGITLVRRRKRA